MGWTISCISFIFCIHFIFGWNKKSEKRRHSAEKISFQQTIDKSSISIFKLGEIFYLNSEFFSWDSFFFSWCLLISFSFLLVHSSFHFLPVFLSFCSFSFCPFLSLSVPFCPSLLVSSWKNFQPEFISFIWSAYAIVCEICNRSIKA